MNTSSASFCEKAFAHHPPLLDRIIAARASTGDGLNDTEFTMFLQQRVLPSEAGFSFVCFSEGVVTLSVPPQDLKTWYPATGWIRSEKEQIGKSIAKKYSISLCEPPDHTPQYVLPSDSTGIHHHLEMTMDGDTIVVAHPQYLKVRLFRSGGRARYAWAQHAVSLRPELLRDLSALYES